MTKKKDKDDIPKENQVTDEVENFEPEPEIEPDASAEEWMPSDAGLDLDDVSAFDAEGTEPSALDGADEFSIDDPFDGDTFDFDDPGSSEKHSSDDLAAKIQEVQDYIIDNKQMLLGVGLVLVILLFWLFSGSSTKMSESEKAIAHQGVISEGIAKREEALEHELKTFEEQFSEYSSQKEHKLSDLGAKVNLLFDHAKTTKQALIQQNKQLSEIKVALQHLAASRTTKAKRAKLLRNRSGLYTVSAIVPGRVWLRSVNGHEFTASIGDKIDGYGTVLKIEAEYGRVLTSSGKSIYLGRDDS